MNNIEQIKKLREETGAGVMDVKNALEESAFNVEKAKEILKKQGFERAEKKSNRETGDGLVFSYLHTTGKVGALVVLNCETDFVAKTEDFTKLGREVAMQVAAMDPKDAKTLLTQPYIRDGSKTIEMLIKEVIGKLGENIRVGDFKRIKV